VRINVFAGARRIALIASVIAIAGTLAVLATSPPLISIKARVDHPEAQFILVDEPCPRDSLEHYFKSAGDWKAPVWVDLCVKAMDFQGRRLIPYKIGADRMVYGAELYSTEVIEYRDSLVERFQLSPADTKKVQNLVSDGVFKGWKNGLFYLAIALFIFWITVWGIGWIVRGFAELPMGKDHRQTGSDA